MRVGLEQAEHSRVDDRFLGQRFGQATPHPGVPIISGQGRKLAPLLRQGNLQSRQPGGSMVVRQQAPDHRFVNQAWVGLQQAQTGRAANIAILIVEQAAQAAPRLWMMPARAQAGQGGADRGRVLRKPPQQFQQPGLFGCGRKD